MRINQLQAIILDELSNNTDGVSFNRLASILRGKISRVTLIKELNKLKESNLISVEKDHFHRQKKIFKLNSRVINLIREIRVHEEIALGDPINSFSTLFQEYCKKIKETRDELLRSYLKIRLSRYVISIIHNF
ncbi:MAG: hypothetical protein N3F64_06255 [Nitrososphaeria archaeon]|nr:hypothetical protein [Nitrososphaeria archaeon]